MTKRYLELGEAGRVLGIVDVDGAALGAGYTLIPDSTVIPAAVPGQELFWENGAFSWRDLRDLAQTKTDKIASLRDARDAYVDGTFVWDNSVFDSDPESRVKLMGLRMAASDPDFQPEWWRLADNSWRQLSAADASAVWLALKAHIRTAFVTFAAKEAQVAQATTIAQVEAISW